MQVLLFNRNLSSFKYLIKKCSLLLINSNVQHVVRIVTWGRELLCRCAYFSMEFFDPRKRFIARSLELCFNLKDSDTTVVYSNSIVETFLSTGSVKLLFVTLTQKQEILFWLEVNLCNL